MYFACLLAICAQNVYVQHVVNKILRAFLGLQSKLHRMCTLHQSKCQDIQSHIYELVHNPFNVLAADCFFKAFKLYLLELEEKNE